MDSVGWQREYETDAVCEFCEIVKLFAAEKPNDAKLQAFARKCRLTALMMLTREQSDIAQRNIIRDRADDCERCRRWNSGAAPCEADGTHTCAYQRAREKARVIRHYFGDEGQHFLEWAAGILRKRGQRIGKG